MVHFETPDPAADSGVRSLRLHGSCDIITADESARLGYLGVCWGLGGGNGIGAPPIASFGTREQKDRFLVPILRGDLTICLGITEPGGGSDVAAVQTTAKPVEGGYLVSGEKKVGASD